MPTTVRLDPATLRVMGRLAHRRGLTKSQLIRQAIRRLGETTGPSRRPKPCTTRWSTPSAAGTAEVLNSPGRPTNSSRRCCVLAPTAGVVSRRVEAVAHDGAPQRRARAGVAGDGHSVAAGPLVALLDRSDRDHAAGVAAAKTLPAPVLSIWPVVTEAMYLLGASWTAPRAVLADDRRYPEAAPIEPGRCAPHAPAQEEASRPAYAPRRCLSRRRG
jgi:hypothetical protein